MKHLNCVDLTPQIGFIKNYSIEKQMFAIKSTHALDGGAAKFNLFLGKLIC
jgi:hypothetical protein